MDEVKPNGSAARLAEGFQAVVRDAVSQANNGIETRVGNLETKVGCIEEILKGHGERLTGIEHSLDRIEKGLQPRSHG